LIAQHSSATVEHYTPADIVEAARATLGGIVLDPASCPEANKTVRAAEYFTQAEDGLARQWHGRIFLNPPGGVLRFVSGRWIVPERRNPHEDKSSAFVWWQKLVNEYSLGRVSSAVFVGFTLEILRTSQEAALPVQAFARCYPRERLRFGGNSPTHGNVIAYLGPDYGRFKAAFEGIGLCEE
jgi:hypothetical protein